MPTGIVTTARGAALNIDELIAKGSRPLSPVAKSTRENGNYIPEVAKPQVRGFVPAAGKSSLEPTDTPVAKNVPKSTQGTASKASNKSMSEMTGITLSKSATKKADTAKQNEVVEDAELGDLLGKLDKSKK
jgi:hypothetical protein